MDKIETAYYINKEEGSGYVDCLSESNIFLIIAIPEWIASEEGRQFLNDLAGSIKTRQISKLIDLETLVSQKIHEANLPLSTSIALGLLQDKIFYLVTINQGKIYIKRDGKLIRLIGDNNSASGYAKTGDTYILTTGLLEDVIGGEKKIADYLKHEQPEKIVNDLNAKFKNNHQMAIALFIHLTKESSIEQNVEPLKSESTTNTFNSLLNLKKRFIDNNNNNSPQISKKKKMTFLIAFILLIILFWSVGLGYQRRMEASNQALIKKSQTEIAKKLQQADDAAFLNLTEALTIINGTKTDFNQLKTKLDNKRYQNELVAINQSITAEESKLLKKEEKNYEEFFDLTIEDKNAQGNQLALDGETLAILDNQQKTTYLLLLSKKSITKQSDFAMKQAKLIGLNQNTVVFYVPGQGIYKTTEGITKKVIDNDKEWNSPNQMVVYNGNIYLMDKGKDEIFKYLSGDDTYSQKSSYFKTGEAVSLASVQSMSIDASIYISFKDYIIKYTAGVRDGFKTSFPVDEVLLTKIYTNKDLDKVYAWDKKQGALYILAKNGTYEKQINAGIFSKANDFIVFNQSAYFLLGAKIYKVSLN
jgi:hypothetical protein